MYAWIFDKLSSEKFSGDSFNPSALYEMANLSPKRTELKATIWSRQGGVYAGIQHNGPYVKITKDDAEVFVSLESAPRILVQSNNIKHSDMKDIKKAMAYVGANYDLFLKHFNSNNEEFDDQDLFNALRERGQFN